MNIFKTYSAIACLVLSTACAAQAEWEESTEEVLVETVEHEIVAVPLDLVDEYEPGELERSPYSCDDIGDACTGGSSGDDGTIQECMSVIGECCCFTGELVEPIEPGLG